MRLPYRASNEILYWLQRLITIYLLLRVKYIVDDPVAGIGSQAPKEPRRIAHPLTQSNRTSKTYASLVTTVHSYIARGAGGCRSGQPQVSGAGWVHSAAGGGDLLVSVPGQPVVQQDHGDRPAGDGPHRSGVLFAGAASARALGS